MADSKHLTTDEVEAIRGALERASLRSVATWLGCSRDALACVLAGLEVRRGTIAVIRARLADRTASSTPGDARPTEGEALAALRTLEAYLAGAAGADAERVARAMMSAASAVG